MSFQQIFQNISRSAMPTFLGIGAPRAGTTWLWENLRKHPDIWTPRTKEVHFFDRRLENRVLPLVPYELEAKHRYIYFFLKGNILGKVTREITPAYSILPQEKIRLIHSWIPKAKIFYVMRDPVLRAWSQARKDFFRLTGKRLDTALKDDIIDFFKLPQIEVRADYLACLENWTNLYDSNQFLLLLREKYLLTR